MKLLVTVLAIAAALLLVAGANGSTATEISLSNPSALATSTSYNSDGSYVVSSAALDTAVSTTTLGTDGYLCGNVQYRATQRWYDPLGIVLWTYRSTFGVHVCHDHVTGLVSLYDEAMDSTLGWTWCGNIVRTWTNNTTSAHSYTKGCFNVFDKILDVRYPWAKMTIGGNGGLWVRKTGVG